MRKGFVLPLLFAGGLALQGYIAAGLDTGHWSIREQVKYTERYDSSYRKAQDLAKRNGERCCDGYEVADIFSKRGLSRTTDEFNPSLEELQRVIKTYGEKP
jgi:hypothetical protein